MKVKLDLDFKYEDVEVIIHAPVLNEEVNMLIDYIKKSKNTSHLLGYKDNRISFLEIQSLYCIYAQEGKVFLKTKDDVYESKYRLYELEEILKNSYFVRISKSEIVNIKQIDYFETDITGSLFIYMKNKYKAYISRRYIKHVKERLGV